MEAPTELTKAQNRKREFQIIIVKCVLHLLVIQTLQETICSKDVTYNSLPTKYLFPLLDCLDASFLFAQKFNNDMDLRMTLYKLGFMKQLPNLLKQETSSVSTYVSLLIRMTLDEAPEKLAVQEQVDARLIPCVQICKNVVWRSLILFYLDYLWTS